MAYKNKSTKKSMGNKNTTGNVRSVGNELYAHPIANKDTMSKYSYEVKGNPKKKY